MTRQSGEFTSGEGHDHASDRHASDAHDLVDSHIQAILRFPDQNPNPVLRMAADGHLTYANPASAPILRTLGLEVGDDIPEPVVEQLRRVVSGAEPTLEVSHGHRTYALLAVAVPELDFINIYGTDITGEKVFERFPNDNPEPVFRVDDDVRLLYANDASRPLIDTYGLVVGDPWPADVARLLLMAADGRSTGLIELEAGQRTFALKPVRIPEFGFINVYGADVTAEKAIAKFPAENPNPVLRLDRAGQLMYANEASAQIVNALELAMGEPVSEPLRGQILAQVESGSRKPIEITAGDLIYEIVPVAVAEFDVINLYGTDVSAARQLGAAKEQTERLLLNILPPTIADRLRSGERIIADRFEDASLLIADIVGFTALSSQMSPKELVHLLDLVFSECDALVERYGLEKVKTIGDAYMVVGGVPLQLTDHVARVADFALDMCAAVEHMRSDLGAPVAFRVGINAGPVVAGVIGNKRTIYDVWGDTVNVASRMESLGVPGRIQVTRLVHERLKDSYEFEARGPIEVKGKGALPTYFLTGRR